MIIQWEWLVPSVAYLCRPSDAALKHQCTDGLDDCSQRCRRVWSTRELAGQRSGYGNRETRHKLARSAPWAVFPGYLALSCQQRFARPLWEGSSICEPPRESCSQPVRQKRPRGHAGSLPRAAPGRGSHHLSGATSIGGRVRRRPTWVPVTKTIPPCSVCPERFFSPLLHQRRGRQGPPRLASPDPGADDARARNFAAVGTWPRLPTARGTASRDGLLQVSRGPERRATRWRPCSRV